MTDAATPTAPAETPYARLVRERTARRRAAAVAAAREAACAAAAHGARLVVFGSLATGRFRETSDVDLAVEGPADRLHAAATAAWIAAYEAGFECDVVILDRAPPGLAERIRRDGREPGALG